MHNHVYHPYHDESEASECEKRLEYARLSRVHFVCDLVRPGGGTPSGTEAAIPTVIQTKDKPNRPEPEQKDQRR